MTCVLRLCVCVFSSSWRLASFNSLAFLSRVFCLFPESGQLWNPQAHAHTRHTRHTREKQGQGGSKAGGTFAALPGAMASSVTTTRSAEGFEVTPPRRHCSSHRVGTLQSHPGAGSATAWACRGVRGSAHGRRRNTERSMGGRGNSPGGCQQCVPRKRPKEASQPCRKPD